MQDWLWQENEAESRSGRLLRLGESEALIPGTWKSKIDPVKSAMPQVYPNSVRQGTVRKNNKCKGGAREAVRCRETEFGIASLTAA